MKPKHAWSALLVVLVVFAAINIRLDMRRQKPGEFGRLSGQSASAETQPMEVVQEAPAPVRDETAADPMLLAPAAREQYLHANTSAAPVIIKPIAAPTIIAPDSERPLERQGKSRYMIVGGADGVTVIEKPQR